MASPVDLLFCSACGGYVHPFLDACPGCGAPRPSRYDDALAVPDLGLRAALGEPALATAVRAVVLRYTMKLLGAEPANEARQGIATIADAVACAVTTVGAQTAGSAGAHLELGADDLVIRERNPAREVVRVPLAGVLAIRSAPKGGRGAGAWAGVAAFGRREAASLPAVDGDLVLAWATPAGPARLAIANRRGLFVARARSDHFAQLGRWLGLVAGAAAEARWTAVGPPRHAVELGLATPAEVGAGGEAAGQPTAPPWGAAGAASIPEALATLEELRARGLVTDAEYAEKRSAILARL